MNKLWVWFSQAVENARFLVDFHGGRDDAQNENPLIGIISIHSRDGFPACFLEDFPAMGDGSCNWRNGGGREKVKKKKDDFALLDILFHLQHNSLPQIPFYLHRLEAFSIFHYPLCKSRHFRSTFEI